MHILLANDDGVFAPGIEAIHKHLTKLGQVTVIAPAQPKSGAGHSISLSPVACEKLDITGKFIAYSVDGSPADCVKIAMTSLLHENHEPIDLVVSGINHGATVGVHVFYSGTVAAAVEAAFEGTPSVALSAVFDEHFDAEKAAAYAFGILQQLLPLHPGDVININIPTLSNGNPKGVVVVPQSTGGFEETFRLQDNKQGRMIFEYTGGRHRDPTVSPADTTSLADGYITVTALHFDMTNYERNKSLNNISWKLDNSD